MARAFDSTSPYTTEDLPDIDAVLITHDHDDHLDYASMPAQHYTGRFMKRH